VTSALLSGRARWSLGDRTVELAYGVENYPVFVFDPQAHAEATALLVGRATGGLCVAVVAQQRVSLCVVRVAMCRVCRTHPEFQLESLVEGGWRLRVVENAVFHSTRVDAEKVARFTEGTTISPAPHLALL
jgi:hypothetical protein